MPECDGVCEVCTKVARQFCSSCRSVFYCSRECQKQDWKTHKGKCKPYTVQNHPVYGRHMVAARDIRAGEIIFKEAPVVVGPRQGSAPLCLGCHRAIDGSYACHACHYPLCGPKCQASPLHKGECAVLSRAQTPLSVTHYDLPCPAYDCITPLRCLLLRGAPDARPWEALTQLQDHEEELRGSQMHGIVQRDIVEFLRGFMGYEGASEKEIYRICGILVTNSFDVRQSGSLIRGLYPQAAMMCHQCAPNTKHCFTKDLTMVLRAMVVIHKGTAITTTYTNTLWNTAQRRRQLQLNKFFLCSCQRCLDPTELGTHFSTVLCEECGGHLLPTTPLDADAAWTCGKCAKSMTAKTVFWGDQILHKELSALEQTQAKPFQDFLDHYSKTLHPGHRFCVEAKHALVKIYGSPHHRYRDLTPEQLDNKIKYCRELVQVAEVVAPGLSLLRGAILLELQAALVAAARLLLSNGAITLQASKDYMTEAVKLLKEATEILRQEPEMEDGGLDETLKKLSEELDL
ncbi:SET domain-containing protein SmydA-8, isoform A [Chionoecetes opilio]|uniref:SET domain-containing protein SmydA-8, isoform A n=1 Tax=Chionoecetes opilio TaxID=41210 RepID=A0A8J4Y1H1_CHIOP|nr:SET domain-containing protein SmydA-8, isoform A [Chionoecetes opilio]